jgi:hypothetical protein
VQTQVLQKLDDKAVAVAVVEGVPVAEEAPAPRRRAPQPGNKVLAYHTPSHAYFNSTIISFDRASRTYTVEWDDGDQTGKQVSWSDLALDVPPEADDVGLDSTVLFWHGKYRMNGGTHKKWHQGVVSHVYTSKQGSTYNGEATTAGSRRNFQDTPLADLRVAPNVMDCLAQDEAVSVAAAEAF